MIIDLECVKNTRISEIKSSVCKFVPEYAIYSFKYTDNSLLSEEK